MKKIIFTMLAFIFTAMSILFLTACIFPVEQIDFNRVAKRNDLNHQFEHRHW